MNNGEGKRKIFRFLYCVTFQFILLTRLISHFSQKVGMKKEKLHKSPCKNAKKTHRGIIRKHYDRLRRNSAKHGHSFSKCSLNMEQWSSYKY